MRRRLMHRMEVVVVVVVMVMMVMVMMMMVVMMMAWLPDLHPSRLLVQTQSTGKMSE